jgi:cupin fold WbuC family metalloprotein
VRAEAPETMPDFMINLADPDSISVFESDRAVTYFCNQIHNAAGNRLFEEMKRLSKKNIGKNLKVCLHHSPDALFHDMIILEHKNNYFRPHKHLNKGETIHLIEGEIAVLVFDTDGGILSACRLNKINPISRVEEGCYHFVTPISDIVIYHESKPGPFLGNNDSFFADWAPVPEDKKSIKVFVEQQLKYFDKDISA